MSRSLRGRVVNMALVFFRSKAAADITMFAENARRIFEIIGRPESARGVITSEQVPDALQRLTSRGRTGKGAAQGFCRRCK